tara:strand:+ start:149 stop:859 length:711 start_codon:yes stop_codon:yes gene_type:complete
MKDLNSIKILHYFSNFFCFLAITFAILWIPCLIYGSFGHKVNLKVNMNTADVFWEKKVIIPDNNNQFENLESDTTDERDFLIIQEVIDDKLITDAVVINSSQKESHSHVYFHNLPTKHRVLILISSLITLFIIIFIAYNFKFFMGKISHGQYFTLGTMKSLKFMSYGLMFIWIDSYTSRYILQNFYASSSEIFENQISVLVKFPSVSPIILGLILWVLSHIFSNGISLKEDNKLTI